MFFFRLVLVGSFILSCGILSFAQNHYYTINDLGSLGGDYTLGWSINNDGRITGVSRTTDSAYAFLYSNGTIYNLGSFPTGGYSVGYDINDNGDVVGYADGGPGNGYQAFLYRNGVMTNHGTLGVFSGAFGVNNAGQVVGWTNETGYGENVINSVAALKNIKFLGKYKDETIFEFYDGKHLFEILIRGKEDSNYFQMNVRFALGNYDTVDHLFLSFVEWCLNHWSASITLQTSILKKKIEYEADEASLFLQNAPEEIKVLREYWLNNFGLKRGPIRTEDAYL